ncbi:MAG: hypothetical protein U1E46_13930 [Hyphomicrobiales bacterium]
MAGGRMTGEDIARARAMRRGKAQTVLGLVDPAALGVTLMHEHLLLDESALDPTPSDPELLRLFEAPLTPEILTQIRYAGVNNRENLIFDDVALSVRELLPFKAAGGGTVVEVTPHGLSRDASGLQQIARRTGVHVIMGCSWYVADSHPQDMGQRSEQSLCDQIVSEVFEGCDGTSACAGIIGEVGCSWPLTDNERKALRASAHAQQLTGASLTVHPGRHPDAPMEIIGVLIKAGADISRTIICHLERTIFDKEHMKALAETGCILEFDLFGHENSYYPPAPHIAMPNDRQRLEWLAWLIEEGHGHQIVIAHDNDNRHHLEAYGGCGFAHISRNVVPAMRRLGFTENSIEAILVETPRRLLTLT